MRKLGFAAALVMVMILVSSVASAQTVVKVAVFAADAIRIQYIENLIADFNARHPDIKAEPVFLAWPFPDAVTTMIAGGLAPDVTEMWGYFALDWAEAGVLKDLTPYVDRDFTAEDVRDFFPGQWDASVLQWGEYAGIRYGIPRYTNVGIMFYNSDLFDQSGLVTPDQLYERGGWTWDDAIEAGRAITRLYPDGSGASQWGYKPRFEFSRWGGVVASFGGKVFDWPENPTRFVLDGPEAIRALEMIQSMIHDLRIAPPVQWEDDFASGRYGFGEVWGTTSIGSVTVDSQGAFRWNIAPTPAGPAGRKPVIFNDMWGITSASQNPDAAWEFVKFATSTEGFDHLIATTGQQPSRRTAVENWILSRPDLDMQYALVSALEAVPDMYQIVPHSATLQNEVLDPAIQIAIYENQSITLTIERIKPVIEALFD